MSARPYCWDKADVELNRRLNVCWRNRTANPGTRRYEPRHLESGPEGGWAVYDFKYERYLTREEVLKLNFAQCCELRNGDEVKMQ